MSTPDPRRSAGRRAGRREPSRRELQLQAAAGFVGFFAALALVQAVVNMFAEQPKVWPAVLALVLLSAAALVIRAWAAEKRRR